MLRLKRSESLDMGTLTILRRLPKFKQYSAESLHKRRKLLRMKPFACPMHRVGRDYVPLLPLDFPVPLCVLIDVSEAPNTTDAITIKPNIPLMLPVRQKAKPCCSQL